MKFRCKQSGNIYEFFYDHDIEAMLAHPQYEEVVEKQAEVKVETKKSSKE